jgi:hypothetical protein
LLVPALLILAFLAIWWLPQIAANVGSAGMPWSLIGRPALTDREQILQRRLATMYPDHVIFTQVPLSQLMDILPATKERSPNLDRLNTFVADFVLCRRDFSIVAVIELADSAGAPLKRRDVKTLKTNAVESAGLRLVRIGTGPIPSQAQIRRILQDRIDS